MANFASKANTSLRGRELGIQRLTTAESGGPYPAHFLVGTVTDIRPDVTFPETTATYLQAHGLSVLSTGSSAVHTLAPPIPGIEKTICCTGGATAYVKTAGSETIESTAGSSFTVMKWTAAATQTLRLVGLTTARWILTNVTSAQVGLLSTTT